MKNNIFLFLVIAFLLTSSRAMADEDFMLDDRGVKLADDRGDISLDVDERPRWGFGLKIGPFEPKFSIAHDYYETYFGSRGKEPFYALEGRFFFYRNTVVQLILHAQLGYWQTYGKSQRCTLNGESSACNVSGAKMESGSSATSLNLMPGELGIEVKLNVFKDRFNVPLVPYIRGSVMYTLWWIYADGLAKSADEERGKGIGGVWGLIGNVGIALNLDWIDRSTAREAMLSWGLKDTYLYFEYSGKTNKNFKSSGTFDFSGHYWTIGISADF